MTDRISHRTVRLIWERERGRCAICGLPVMQGRANRHHRLPGKMGGRADDPKFDTAANVIRAHASCHDTVESKRITSYTCGWLVEEDGDPAKVPFLYAGVGWVLLAEDGSVTPVDAPEKRDMAERLTDVLTSDPSSFTARTEAVGGVGVHPSPPAASLSDPVEPSPAESREGQEDHETSRSPGREH